MTKQFYLPKVYHAGFSVAFCLFFLAFPLAGCKKQEASGSEAELARAKKLIAQGNYAEAFIELNQALAEAPRDPNVHLNLGWLYLYTNDQAHAQRELGVLESLAPDQAETFHLRGALFASQAQQAKTPEEAKDQQEQAVENFQQSLSRNDANYQTYFDMATSLAALSRHPDALKALDKGFEYIPKGDLETQVNFEIASCASNAKMQLFDEAIADCNQALEFTSNPASRERIEEMIQNMKLLNPSLNENATSTETP